MVNALHHRVAVSESLAHFLRDNGIQVDTVIHNGLKPSGAENKERSREHFDLQGPTLLFAGRISHFKGSLKLADALKEISLPNCSSK